MRPTFTRDMLTAEFVASVVEKRGETYFWRFRSDIYFASEDVRNQWNRKFAGKPITLKKMVNGYLAIRILSHLVLCHRLNWVLHYGIWPTNELDHIDGNKTNCAISNLRDVPKSINMRNQKLRADNTSGCPGVYWSSARRRWRAVIRFDGKAVHLGQFVDCQDAIAARRAAQVRYGFTVRHGNKSEIEGAAA